MKQKTWAIVVVCALASGSVAVFSTPSSQGSRAEKLIQAVRHEQFDRVRQLVKGGVSVDARLPGEGTALIVAAKRGDLAMVDALLALGADVNESLHGDGNPLIAASAAGHVKVVARLLRAGARVDVIVPGDETALITAVRNNRLKTVEFPVEHGAGVNLGAMANGNQWRTPLNQARSGAIRAYLLSKGAVTRPTPRGDYPGGSDVRLLH